MNTKLYSSMIVTLLVVGMVLTLPIASVQAWGWRPRSKTPFTVIDGFMLGPPDVTPIKEIGDRILEKHEFVWWNDADDDRADGYNHNTLFWLWEGEPLFSDGIMWGTRIVRDGPLPSDTSIGRGYTYGRIVDGIFTWKAVEYRKGPSGTFKVISWSSAPFFGEMDIHGIIIET